MSNKVTTLMIFGKSGSGISSTANTILGESKFKVHHGMASTPEEFHTEKISRQRKTIEVIPIPDLCKNSGNDEQSTFLKTVLDKWKPKDLTAILMIIKADERFTDEDYKNYEKMKSLVGDDVMLNKLIVVFTAYSDVESAIEEMTGTPGEILTNAKRRCVCIDNNGSDSEKEIQVSRLLTAVDRLTDPQLPERTHSTDTQALEGTHSTDTQALEGTHSTDTQALEGTHSTDPQALEGTHSTDPQPLEGTHSTDPQPLEGTHSTDPQPLEGTHSTDPQPLEGTHSTDPQPLEGTHSTDPQPPENTHSADTVAPGCALSSHLKILCFLTIILIIYIITVWTLLSLKILRND